MSDAASSSSESTDDTTLSEESSARSSAAESSNSESPGSAILSEDVPSWLSAIEVYVRETTATSLDLSHKNIGVTEIASILKILPDSEITELDLEGNDLSEGIKSLFELIKRTKIKKLNLDTFQAPGSCPIAFMGLLNDAQIVDVGDIQFWLIESQEINDDIKFGIFLRQSCMTKLCLNFDRSESSLKLVDSLTNQLPYSSLSSLRLTFIYNSYPCAQTTTDILVSLFSQLSSSQIQDLDLSDIRIDCVSLAELSRNLANSKLKKLNLNSTEINDVGLDILAEGLPNSKLSELYVNSNEISGLNSFGYYLKSSKLTVLDVSFNRIQDYQMFNFPESLSRSLIAEISLSQCQFSDETGAKIIQSLACTKLTKLDLSSNDLGVQTISALASMLEHTGLEDIDFSYNLLHAEAFDILSGCVKQSKLKSIRFHQCWKSQSIPCLRFLAATQNSSLLSIHLNCFTYFFPDLFSQMLANSRLTSLDLSESFLGDVFTDLVANLKYTCIAHLNLCYCGIDDEHVQLLAENLKDCKVIELNLNRNHITSEGAGVLAACCPQTSIISLDLGQNEIEKDGFEILAENLAGSLISTCNIQNNRCERILLIDKILLENRVTSYKIVAAFKQVFPENGNMYFNQSAADRNVGDFLEHCLQFYKTIVDQPQRAVVSTLLQGDYSSSLREKLAALVDNFPSQLVEFISRWVEADASQHVEFLVRAEELGLVKIVELLLLQRPLYIIDEAEGILHPMVYGLLVKYKQPICSVAIEPHGVVKIIKYLTKYSDLEGVADVISLLQGLR